MAKKPQKPAKLWEGFPKPLPNEGKASEGPLLPRRRRNPLPIIIPLLLIAGILGASYWAYEEYLAPQYSAEETAYDQALTTAEAYEGETVKAKDEEDDCFSLKFDREKTIHSLCVSEELWNEQVVGEPFDLKLLRDNKVEPEFKLPWF